MIRRTFSILLASAIAAGCTVTSTPAGTDGGPGAGDAGGGGDAAATDDTDASPDAHAPSEAGTVDGGPSGGCAFGEPNDTRETATPVALNQAYTGLCVSNADAVTDQSDFYVITAPADTAGGYVAFTISNVSADGDVEAVVTAVADHGPVADVFSGNDGESISGWFTVSPGAKYAVEVKRFGGIASTFTYDLDLAYTKITDAYEPNNTRADAKPIALGTSIQASASASSANGALGPDDDADWYAVTLAAGAATVTLSNVPADFICDVQLYDSSGAGVAGSDHAGAGANCEIDATELVGGAYTVVVQAFTGTDRGGSGPVPPSVSGLYTLDVTQ